MGVINPMLQHNEDAWAERRPEPYEYHARGKTIALWVAVAILSAILGALVYYGYRTVRTQDLRITQIFGNQGALSTLGQRADAAENKLHDLAGDWQGLGQRVAKLEGRVAADARETRGYAERLTQQLHQQMTAELDARTSPLDARLQQVEAEEANQRAQMAQAESNLKQEIAAVRQENGRDLSGVRQQEETNARDVNALSERLDTRRVDFELAKGQSKELAPGITLRVAGTNAGRERYHGLLSLTQEHRAVWLKDQSAHQPVRFFPRGSPEPYELVVTDVSKRTVAGYLLTPVSSNSAAAEADGQQAPADASIRN